MTRKQIAAVCGAVVLAVVVPLLTLALLHEHGGETQAAPGSACTAPDNGTGTATLPPLSCEYTTLPDDPLMIIEGLPPGTTIEMPAILMNFVCSAPPICGMGLPPGQCETAGGSLGGHGCCADATLDLTLTGTGDLTGFNRHLVVPVALEAHSGPRNPGDPVQTFPRDMYRLQGGIAGDPDFDTLIVTAGTDFGLPGPGETTLTELPSGDYAVDSFFDITYHIEFVGAPGSMLDGMAGTTIATSRIETGDGGPYDTLKWVQMPDESPWGLDVGTLEPGFPLVLADDFLCTESGLITEIDFWASWYHDEPPFGDPALVQFTLSLHSDVPAGVDLPWSHPGELLWEYWFDVGSCIAEPWGLGEEGWFDPPAGYYEVFADSQIWLYSCPIPEPYWFQQEEGTVYWLDIQAVPIEPVFFFGWKTSIEHWNDDGVWAMGYEPIPPLNWIDLRYPPLHPLFPESIDLSFQIWGQECASGVDTDLDGFDDDVECYLGTDFRDDCTDGAPHDAWPLDINMDAYISVVGDVLEFRGHIGAGPLDPDWDQRLDLSMDSYLSVVGDVLIFRGNVGTGCT